MNRCPKCKNELVDEARFCNICGTPAQPPSSPSFTNIESPAPLPTPIRTIQPVVKRIPIPAETKSDQPHAESQTLLPDQPATAPLPQPDQPASPTLPAQAEKPSQFAPGIIRPIVSSSTVRRNPPATPAFIGNAPSQPISLADKPPAQQDAPVRSSSLPRNFAPVSPLPPVAIKTTLAQPDQQARSGQPAPLPPAPKQPGYSNRFSPPEPATRLLPGMLPDTPSPESLPTQHLAKSNLHTAQNGNAQEPPIFFSASQAYTSKAAEHWRGSWRDRQYAEAGPAEDVSKGQASVSSPLQSMQNSIVRMRAVILKQKEDKRKVSFGFWMTILLMICLIGGLSAYIFYSYLPNSSFNAAHLSQPAAGQSPSLSIEGTTTTTFKIGQTLHITGSHFGAHDTITFLLDTTTPITNSNGSPLRVQTDSKGAFGVSITIGKNWPTGDRNIQAVDANANTSSYLDIQIIPASKPVTSSPDMSISLNDQPIPVLTFTKRVGQADPPAKRITITNTSNAVLQWSAEVSTDQNLGWLVIEDNNYSGQLAISEPQEIGIGVDATGLGITQLNKPYIQYKGQVLFTINNTEVLTLPVQLTITNASAELVFSPTPVIGMAKNGSCQAGSTLTLINLGAVIVSWAVNPDEAGFIQFVDNQGKSSGTLQPSGTAGDTVVLTLRCAGVSKDQAYSLSIYGNGIPARDTVMIQ